MLLSTYTDTSNVEQNDLGLLRDRHFVYVRQVASQSNQTPALEKTATKGPVLRRNTRRCVNSTSAVIATPDEPLKIQVPKYLGRAGLCLHVPH